MSSSIQVSEGAPGRPGKVALAATPMRYPLSFSTADATRRAASDDPASTSARSRQHRSRPLRNVDWRLRCQTTRQAITQANVLTAQASSHSRDTPPISFEPKASARTMPNVSAQVATDRSSILRPARISRWSYSPCDCDTRNHAIVNAPRPAQSWPQL